MDELIKQILIELDQRVTALEGRTLKIEMDKAQQHVFAGVRKKTKYPFRQMETGESFFIPVSPGFDLRTPMQNVCTAAYHFAKRHGGKYSCRAIDEADERGIRVWKTK